MPTSHTRHHGAARSRMQTARFFVYDALLAQAERITDCFQNQSSLHELSRTQFLFELDILKALADHPLRTYARAEASVFVLPLVPFVSWEPGACASSPTSRNSSNHGDRMAQTLKLLAEVDFSAGPHLLTCTCVMQRSVYTPPLFDFLLTRNASLMLLSQARRDPPLSVSWQDIIVPYHSAPSLWKPTCESVPEDAALAVFAGSISTGRAVSTRVREHILNLSFAEPTVFAVRRTERRADESSCGADGSCVNGFRYSARHERVPAKPLMAALMHNASFCFVPEGDSPESSRLFDAVASLCTPVVITSMGEGLLVPRARAWRRAVLVVADDDFVASSAAAVARWLRSELGGAAKRCEALRELREQMAAREVLRRAVLDALTIQHSADLVQLGSPSPGAGERHSTVDSDVLRPHSPRLIAAYGRQVHRR